MLVAAYQSLTLSDFPGVPSSIVFTRGCNLKCPYCHNKSLWSTAGDIIPTEEILLSISQSKLPGVVITGGEPTIHDDLVEFIEKLRQLDKQVKLDTNGSFPSKLDNILPLVSFVAMDVKAPPEHYSKVCGIEVAWDVISRSIDCIVANGVDHLFRTTVDTDILEEREYKKTLDYIPSSSLHIFQEKIVESNKK